ncbi:MAG TPA: pantetheine-phosphate adenylyltransferase [Peptococcaceae bacterium]|nr:pantetheine-phosphate adenylyltransferase [Peptococcaceae bacterium]
MRTGVYPGSFDPVTYGHLDVIQRAANLFDKLIVAISRHTGKTPLFSLEERRAMLEEVLAPYPNVTVDVYEGLTVNYVRRQGGQAIVRGLRAISDFEYEFTMALTNKKLAPDIETIFLMTEARYSFLSSSLIKEIALLKGCLADFVPPPVEAMLRAKFS